MHLVDPATPSPDMIEIVSTSRLVFSVTSVQRGTRDPTPPSSRSRASRTRRPLSFTSERWVVACWDGERRWEDGADGTGGVAGKVVGFSKSGDRQAWFGQDGGRDPGPYYG